MEVATLISLALTLIKGGEELYQFIVRERERLQQTGEWTPEQEAAFDALQTLRAQQPWQKPEPE